MARYACFQGYHLVGPPQVECRYGQWYSPDAPVVRYNDNPFREKYSLGLELPSYPIRPTCKPILCNHPNIDHGGLETGPNVRYRSGQEATVECKDGYELEPGSSSKVICKEDGSWISAENDKDEFPVCRGKKKWGDLKDKKPSIRRFWICFHITIP